jgi:iron complex transport system substrate-binding protein
MYPPNRIVCLTEETVEVLYLLGEQDRIAGISGYVVRPPQARREKPRVSSFTSADIEKISALNPDLVLAFSDIQADIVANLVRQGIQVHAFNQRTVAGILDMIHLLGAMVGVAAKADALVDRLQQNIDRAKEQSSALKVRPKVFFEEWHDPLISGIGWVSELVEIAGGIDVFPQCARQPAAKDRVVKASDVVKANPDIIIGSWCGRRFQPSVVIDRPGFSTISAVRNNQLREIKSPIILQPGPAALTDGLSALQIIIDSWTKLP